LVLRFGNSLNPDEPQPLARYLDLEVVPTVAGYDPTLQLTHRDDCVEALRLAAKRGPAGAYNIAAPGAEPLSKLLDAAGKLRAPRARSTCHSAECSVTSPTTTVTSTKKS